MKLYFLYTTWQKYMFCIPYFAQWYTFLVNFFDQVENCVYSCPRSFIDNGESPIIS